MSSSAYAVTLQCPSSLIILTGKTCNETLVLEVEEYVGPGVLTDDAVTAFTLACSLGPELPFGFASVPSLSSVVLRSKEWCGC